MKNYSSFDVSDAIERKIKDEKITIDIGGHNRSNDPNFRADNKSFLTQGLSSSLFFKLSQEDINYLASVLKEKKKPSHFVSLSKSCLFKCYDCGEEIELQFDGEKFKCDNPCLYPDGLIYEFEINIPSGKMVVANDLREYWKVCGSYNINTAMGCCKTTKKYAEVGMAHAFVGNSCPTVYRIKEDKFAIGINRPIKKARSVASICTDLWWYSIVDYDDFAACVCKTTENVVKCKPGVYRFKHVFHVQNSRSYEKPQVYTEIDWIREPDPIVDHHAHYNNLHLTAEQVIADSLNGWTKHWKEENNTELDGIQSCVDHVMCVLGNGYDYHRNGFLIYNPDMNNESPSVEIPVLSKQYSWYPLSDSSFIIKAALGGKNWHHDEDIVLNKSFANLAFNILHCISKYGISERHQWINVENNQSLAQKALKGMVERYPQWVPKYVETYFASK